MNKIFKIILLISLIIIAIIIAMFYFKICPPRGPWISPPWCTSNFLKNTYNLNVKASHLNQIKAVNMADTWGANYNFGMFENTRNNIENSFDRVKELGSEEVYVHDFHRAVYKEKQEFTSLNYEIVDEIFANDMRDESITEKDLQKLTKNAHERGLKLGIKHNMAFVDIGKYMINGLTQNIGTSVSKDFEDFNYNHTEEWIKDFFNKWESRLIEKGKIYNKYGVDIMSITPSWMNPTFAGHEELANDLYKKLINNLKGEFKGQIHTELNIYGIIDGINGKEDWNKYDYYKLTDIKEVRVYSLPNDKYKQEGINSLLNYFNSWANEQGIKLSIFFSPFSYHDALNGGIVEFHDSNKDYIKAIEKDWDDQVESWQIFFESINGLNNLERIVASSMWWDDAMDPEVNLKISISPSFRNKPAEEVIKQWYLK